MPGKMSCIVFICFLAVLFSGCRKDTQSNSEDSNSLSDSAEISTVPESSTLVSDEEEQHPTCDSYYNDYWYINTTDWGPYGGGEEIIIEGDDSQDLSYDDFDPNIQDAR